MPNSRDNFVTVYFTTSDGSLLPRDLSIKDYRGHLQTEGLLNPRIIKRHYRKIDDYKSSYEENYGPESNLPTATHNQHIYDYATKIEKYGSSYERNYEPESHLSTAIHHKNIYEYARKQESESKKGWSQNSSAKKTTPSQDAKSTSFPYIESIKKIAKKLYVSFSNCFPKKEESDASPKVTFVNLQTKPIKRRQQKAVEMSAKPPTAVCSIYGNPSQETQKDPIKNLIEEFNTIINTFNQGKKYTYLYEGQEKVITIYAGKLKPMQPKYYSENQKEIIKETLKQLKNIYDMEKETYKTHYSSGAPSRKDEEQIKKTKLSKIKTAINELNDPESTFRQRYKDTLGRKIFDEKLHEKINSKARSAEAAEAYTESESSAANTPIAKGNLSPKAVVASAKPAPRSFPDDAESTLPAKNNETIVRGHFQLSSVKQRQQPSKKIPSTSPQRSAAQRLLPPHFSRQP